MALPKSYVLFLALMGLLAVGSLIYVYSPREAEEFHLVPSERPLAEFPGTAHTEVGTGWSVKGDPEEAVAEAVAMALTGKKHATPHFAVLFASSGSDLKAVLAAARKRLGEKTKIYGGSSDSRALMTNKKFVRMDHPPDAGENREQGVAIMTVTSKKITFGVGAAKFSAYPSARQAAKEALRKALASAGKSQEIPPQAVLLTPTFGVEDQVLKGLEEVIGRDALVLGGTAGGPKFGVFGEQEVYDEGLSLAVMYTTLPLAWVFVGGFDVVEPISGIVTKVEGQAIMEIDHRPALEVYDNWLGGKITGMIAQGVDLLKIQDHMTLHPLVRRYASPSGRDYFLFSHPYPTDRTFKDNSISTSTNISSGDRVHLSHGTWEKLLNRVTRLPLEARARSHIPPKKKALLGLGYICAGVMGIIPEAEREKIPFLINYANNNAPFITNFTWGEQGLLPGVSLKHGNLLTSFLLVLEK